MMLGIGSILAELETRAGDSAAANALLERGRAFLDDAAQRIEDPELRRSFLDRQAFAPLRISRAASAGEERLFGGVRQQAKRIVRGRLSALDTGLVTVVESGDRGMQTHTFGTSGQTKIWLESDELVTVREENGAIATRRHSLPPRNHAFASAYFPLLYMLSC